MARLLVYTGELVYWCTPVHNEVCMASLLLYTGELVYCCTAVHTEVCMVNTSPSVLL